MRPAVGAVVERPVVGDPADGAPVAVIDVSAIKAAEYSIEDQRTRLRSEVWLDLYAGDHTEEGRLVWDHLAWEDWNPALP